MATTTRSANRSTSKTAVALAVILLAVSVVAFQACSDSSSTRSQAQSATNDSGDYQVRVIIQSPRDGDTIAWILNATTGEFETDSRWEASATGGSGTYSYTWNVVGPNTSISATGENPDEITLAENGVLTLTVTAVDSNGLSDSDTIRVNSVVNGLTTFRLDITQPITATFTLGETIRTTVAVNGGSGNYSVLWEPTGGPISPATSTALSQVWTPLAVGNYTFEVTVTDRDTGEVLIDSFAVTVN